ncbi:MAG TPA: alpha-L-rhamnosidase N-terminal domain-containing protein, partial [Glaciihabitans sp.]|nr:alpha-L-rhamnosidase N-terminal domain-containing protein [Glaciihabitans sp.]
MSPTIIRPVRFEHHTIDTLGIGVSTPRLSWQISAEPGFVQAGYELEFDRAGSVQSTGRVDSAEQVLVAWPLAPLASRESVGVRVRVFGDDGSISAFSDTATVEAGLLEPTDWVAQAVGAGWPEELDTDRRPPLVRREFSLEAPVRSARLYVTAHGVHETEINGQRVSDDVLSPGWTVYGQRLRYYTHDVTELLTPGANAIGAWLGDGWYRGRMGFNGGQRNLYGADASLLAQLEVEYVDGRRETIATDGTWLASTGPILTSGLYDGESYDSREEQPGFSQPGFVGSGWSPVAISPRDPATLVAPDGPPVRCTEELEPVSVTRSASGAYLLDFGQNLV